MRLNIDSYGMTMTISTDNSADNINMHGGNYNTQI